MDEPILGFHIHNDLPLHTGIWYERREAARFALYKWEEFLDLPDDSKAGVVAHYRLHKRIEAMASDYESKKYKRK